MGVSMEHYLDQIDAAVADGHDIDWIDEQIIQRSGFCAECSAALWLYAFVRIAQADPREATRVLIAEMHVPAG
jgi:hypothetical protein